MDTRRIGEDCKICQSVLDRSKWEKAKWLPCDWCEKDKMRTAFQNLEHSFPNPYPNINVLLTMTETDKRAMLANKTRESWCLGMFLQKEAGWTSGQVCWWSRLTAVQENISAVTLILCTTTNHGSYGVSSFLYESLLSSTASRENGWVDFQ